MDALRIYFRQHQLTDIDNNNQNVIVDCGTIATYVPGNVDQTWYEMTAFTEGLEKFQSSWDSVNQGDSSSSATNAAGSNYDKGISLSLTFFGDAFKFIWDYLLTTQCQILNAIDVRIDDVICKKSYRLFEIKCDNLKYQPEFDCRIEVQLREQDLVWHCVHKTFIWDDWQGWFNSKGTSTKEHPTFLTCIEPRPRIMNSVRIAFLIFYYSNPAIGAIDWFTGNDIMGDARKVLDVDNFVPAPLIRDYIDNVAMKCGLQTDTIFHRVGTPEYYACLYHPLSGNMYENASETEISNSTKFIFENRWDITLAEFLDKLKVLYCAEWYVTPNNTVVFKPTYELINLAPIFDFTDGTYPVRHLTYSFDGTKKPAYGRYQYQPDGSDLGSQEISNLYNDLTDYDGPSNNPMLEGEKSKSFEFAPTAFVRDGRTKDYLDLLIEDGVIVGYILIGILAVITAAAVAGTLSAGMAVALLAVAGVWANNIRNKRIELRREFVYQNPNYTGAVRLVTANQTMTPRILIWDGQSKQRAKVVVNGLPTPSPYYNPDGTAYNVNNDISKDNPSQSIYNYPAYFDSKYQFNMFDRFHDIIDNPLKSLETNQQFDFDTDLCCDVLTLLGLWEDDFVKIGYLIIIEKRLNYNVYGRIEHIAISYDDYTVKIKGTVIRRPAYNPPTPPPPPPPVEQGFTYYFGETGLDTTGAPLTEAEYIAGVQSSVATSGTAANTGDNVSAAFTNATDKVLYISVPKSEAVFTKWTEVGNSLQQNQPIDNSISGGNVFFRTSNSTFNIYVTRYQTSFTGQIILSR